MEQNQQWRSPRGYRSPPPWQSPRYRGSPGQSANMGRYQSPRPPAFRPHYNRNASPYGYGQSPQQYYSPYHRPRGWSPRHSSPHFSHDRSFSSPNFAEGRQGRDFSSDNIENWVSPEMWGDPWAELMLESSPKPDKSVMEDEEIAASEAFSTVLPACPKLDISVMGDEEIPVTETGCVLPASPRTDKSVMDEEDTPATETGFAVLPTTPISDLTKCVDNAEIPLDDDVS